MFSRASQHVMLIQEQSKLQETLSHCSSLCWICSASKHLGLRFNDPLILIELKTLLPSSPVFFLIWKVNWGIRNIAMSTKPENPNRWRPKSWYYYVIQINPNVYFSLVPLTHSAVYMKLRTRMEGLTCLCLVPSQAYVLCCSSHSIDRIHETDFLCKLLLPFSWWSKSCTPACHSACSDGAC